MAELLERVNGAVTEAVRGVFLAPPSRVANALLAHVQTPVPAAHVSPVAATSGTSFSTEIQNWALQWEPVLMIVFFSALLLVLWRTLKVRPRVKPQQIKPASKQAVSFADVHHDNRHAPVRHHQQRHHQQPHHQYRSHG